MHNLSTSVTLSPSSITRPRVMAKALFVMLPLFTASILIYLVGWSSFLFGKESLIRKLPISLCLHLLNFIHIYNPYYLNTLWVHLLEVGEGMAYYAVLNVTGPLPSPQKVGLMGFAMPPFISPGPSNYLFDVGPFYFFVTFSPTQSCDALVTDGAPYLLHPLGCLARHQSRVWVGSHTTCH